MLNNLDIFIKYDGDIEDIADKISDLLDVKMTKEIDDVVEVQRYRFKFLDIEFVLFDNHELEDDCGIVFTDYNYELGVIKLRIGQNYKYYDEMYDKTAMFLMEKLSYSLNANVMLVENLQTLVMSTIPVSAS